MERRRLARWARIGAVTVVAVLLLGLLGVTWYFSGVIGEDVFRPRPFDPEPELEVIAVGQGTITLTRDETSELQGVWGLVGPNGYGQVGTLVDIAGERVERSFLTLEGGFGAGDRVRFDQYAYAGDPFEAHGIAFEEVLVPGPLGFYPAWVIDGDGHTWVVVVHGKGLDERRQALRIIPALHEADLPVLVISYRNDTGAPASPDGLYGWGRDEWRDVEAALSYAVEEEDAEGFVLVGYSMGGAITATYLREALDTSLVAGVVWDSPVLDLDDVVRAGADDRGVPGFVTAAALTVSSLRYGVDWGELDHVAAAGEFDLPILLMHGERDGTVPIDTSAEYAAARPDLVTFERFEDADHVWLWNTAPRRYEDLVLEFVGSATSSGTE